MHLQNAITANKNGRLSSTRKRYEAPIIRSNSPHIKKKRRENKKKVSQTSIGFQ